MSGLNHEQALSYATELRGLRDAIAGPSVGALAQAEIEELRRLVLKYPQEAERALAGPGVPKTA